MNTICLTGRIDDEPIRKEVNDSVVVTIRLAVGTTGRRGGRLWIDIDTWGHLAGVTHRAAEAGRDVAVIGRLAHDAFTRRNGERGERWYVVASDIEYLTGPTRSTTDSTDPDDAADLTDAARTNGQRARAAS